MKANELRIGNCLMSDGIPVQIDGRTIFDFWHYGDNGVIPLKYEPIPLTEEWLKRFGFEQFGVESNWEKRTYFLNQFTIHQEPDSLDRYMIIPSCCTRLVINYVHQLQNLFFAMKGEELELK